MKGIILKTIALFISIGLFSCSGELDADTAAVNISTSPISPIISQGTVQITDAEGNVTKTLQPSWFKFSLVVDNQSTKQLIITGLNLTITFTKDRTEKTHNASIDAIGIKDDSGNPITQLIDIAAGTGPITESLILYVDGLPESDDNSYSVEVTPLGHFGTLTKPEKIFQRKYYFTTSSGL